MCSLQFTVTSTSGSYSSPMVFLDFRFLQQQLKVGGGLALFNLSLCSPLKVAFLFLLLYFIFTEIHFFPIEKTKRNARKKENLTKNHTTPLVSEIHTKQSTNKENSTSLFMNKFCRNKNKGRNLKSMKSQYYALKPQQNCTIMNTISGYSRVCVSPWPIFGELYNQRKSGRVALQ